MAMESTEVQIGRLLTLTESHGVALASISEKLDGLTNTHHGLAVEIASIKAAIHLDSNTLPPISERVSNMESQVASHSGKWKWIAGVGGTFIAALIAHTVIQYL